MSYEYDGNGGLQPAPPKKNDNDLGAWIFIAVMFAVAWPVGLILLLMKLSEGGKKKVRRQTARSDAAQKTVQQVTRTPEYSARSGKIMKTVGAVLGIVGALFLLRQLDFTLGYAIEYGEWMYLLRQIFYPVGMLAGGASLLLGSGVIKRRQRRFATYLRTAGQKQAVPLDYLARAADVSRRRVEKDINAMLEKGLWGDEAYIDMGSGMLFRSQDAASAYFDAARRARAEQESPVQTAPEGYAGILRQIRELNDRIADEALSAKLDRLEQLSGRIFKLVEENEEKRAAASTFLNYYLPTTLKLMENYANFEEAGVSGENLSQAKAKIEKTMDSIVAGFEHQRDALYRTDAMDIASDIQVMETMLRRDTASVADDFGLGGGSAVQQEED